MQFCGVDRGCNRQRRLPTLEGVSTICDPLWYPEAFRGNSGRSSRGLAPNLIFPFLDIAGEFLESEFVPKSGE